MGRAGVSGHRPCPPERGSRSPLDRRRQLWQDQWHGDMEVTGAEAEACGATL